jgi:hypothetical protein
MKRWTSGRAAGKPVETTVRRLAVKTAARPLHVAA